MEYKVVDGKKEYELAEKVNALIKQGWRPQGGVSVVMTDSIFYVWLFQAMVRD